MAVGYYSESSGHVSVEAALQSFAVATALPLPEVMQMYSHRLSSCQLVCPRIPLVSLLREKVPQETNCPWKKLQVPPPEKPHCLLPAGDCSEAVKLHEDQNPPKVLERAFEGLYSRGLIIQSYSVSELHLVLAIHVQYALPKLAKLALAVRPSSAPELKTLSSGPPSRPEVRLPNQEEVHQRS